MRRCRTRPHFDLFHPAFGGVKCVPRHRLQLVVVEVFNRAETILVRHELQDAAESLVALFPRDGDLFFRRRRIAAAFFISRVDRLIIFWVERMRIIGIQFFLFERTDRDREANQEGFVEDLFGRHRHPSQEKPGRDFCVPIVEHPENTAAARALKASSQ